MLTLIGIAVATLNYVSEISPGILIKKNQLDRNNTNVILTTGFENTGGIVRNWKMTVYAITLDTGEKAGLAESSGNILVRNESFDGPHNEIISELDLRDAEVICFEYPLFLFGTGRQARYFTKTITNNVATYVSADLSTRYKLEQLHICETEWW
jgi:hypothetical protein